MDVKDILMIIPIFMWYAWYFSVYDWISVIFFILTIMVCTKDDYHILSSCKLLWWWVRERERKKCSGLGANRYAWKLVKNNSWFYKNVYNMLWILWACKMYKFITDFMNKCKCVKIISDFAIMFESICFLLLLTSCYVFYANSGRLWFTVCWKLSL